MRQQVVLSSVHNPQIKRVRKLHEAKARRQEGVFLLEGTRLLTEAGRSGWEILELYATSRWLEHHPAEAARAVAVAEHVLEAMSSLETPEGVIALARLPASPELPEIRPDSLWVGCDRLQDPGNLGTIIRTADAAGAEAVLVGPGTADPFSPKVLRASMGSVLHLRIVPFEDLEDLRSRTRQGEMRWLGTVPRTGASLFESDLRGPVCWWIGNEAAGLGPEIVARADLTVEIPMPGRAESLNAASAAAICLFETVRQRS